MQTNDLSEIRNLAKAAYIYGFPMVDSYRIQYAYFVDSQNPEYKAPWNQLRNIARVFTPEDKAVQTPNSDTPYSMAGLDLRAEPMVLTVPEIEANRYFSIQLVTCIPSTSRTSVAAPRAMAAAFLSLLAPVGRAKPPAASAR